MKWRQQRVHLVDPFSIVVVGSHGGLRQLFTPFRVQCRVGVDKIPIGAWVYVDAVYVHPTFLLLFQVHQRLYPYHYFQIHIMF
jgi:hypothetical protein